MVTSVGVSLSGAIVGGSGISASTLLTSSGSSPVTAGTAPSVGAIGSGSSASGAGLTGGTLASSTSACTVVLSGTTTVGVSLIGLGTRLSVSDLGAVEATPLSVDVLLVSGLVGSGSSGSSELIATGTVLVSGITVGLSGLGTVCVLVSSGLSISVVASVVLSGSVSSGAVAEVRVLGTSSGP